MAILNLLPRKAFEIVLSDGIIIKGQFGTWALKRFCQKRNYTLAQAGESFSTNPQIDDVIEFILSAVEQTFRESKSKEGFAYNDVDCGKWIDELGGFMSKDSEVWKLMSHSASEYEEKKSDQMTQLIN